MMLKIIKQNTPKRIKKWIKKIFFSNLKPSRDKQNLVLHYCNVCDSETQIVGFPYHFYFDKFYEHGFVFSPFLFETLNLKYYNCKTCGATDRDRLLALYLGKFFKSLEHKVNVLDFAPSLPLQKFILKHDVVQYRSADLYMKGVDDVVDITDMYNYSDESFDVFICSHVLEHIEDDHVAMQELSRILKPNGIGLVLVPILLGLESTVEDKSYLSSEHLRWKYFGQGDHVRLYSKNSFVNRLEVNGFEVTQLGVDYFSENVYNQSGIDLKSVLYLVKKKHD